MTKKDGMPQDRAESSAVNEFSITLDVEPRKPRIAWQGMERMQLAGAVPAQVVEVVSPGRAVERKDELDLMPVGASNGDSVRPENRLIYQVDISRRSLGRVSTLAGQIIDAGSGANLAGPLLC